MGKYILRRILLMIPVLIGATLLIYAFVFLLPGDPVAAMFGDKAPNPEIVAQIKSDYNLDQPFIIQYLLFLKNALTLNFGKTLAGVSVNSIIASAYPNTVKLALMAFCFEAIIGTTLGVIAGVKKGKLFDTVALVVSLVLISVPTFVMGFVLQFVFGFKLGILPATVGTKADFYHLLMPALVLGSVSIAYVLRLTRSSISENSRTDYVRTAYAKGLNGKQVLFKHILRNSLIPVVTFLGADLGALMGGAIITERVFNINGIGNQLYNAIIKGDSTVVVPIVTLLVLVFIVANLLVDILYALLDPRIRYC